MIVLTLCVVMALSGQMRAVVILFAVIPMASMAAFNLPAVGGATITASDLTVLVLFGMVAVQAGGLSEMAGTLRPGRPGFLLLLFMFYATIATVFSPRVFEGQTEVFAIGRVANVIGVVSRPLRPEGGNISQLFRMLISVLAFVSLAALFRRRPDFTVVRNALVAATLVHVVMGVMDVLTYSTGTTWLMEVFRTANYSFTTNHEMSGVKRMIGGFPEASAFGYFTMGIFAFWLRYWLAQPMRLVAGIYLLLSAAVLLRSTSSSAYVAVAVLIVVMGVGALWGVRHLTVPRRIAWVLGLTVALLPLLVMAVIAAYELAPAVKAFLDRSLLNKLESDSGIERMSWNAQALRNFRDTWLLGAGLGSVRASNWLIACLATTGVIGTALIVGWVWSILRLRRQHAPREAAILIAALQAGCLGLLLRALVVKASPNLDVLFFAFAGAAAGLSAAYLTEKKMRVQMMPAVRAHRGQETV